MSSPGTLLLRSIIYQHLLVLAVACGNKFISFARSRLKRREREPKVSIFLMPEKHAIQLFVIPEGLGTEGSVSKIKLFFAPILTVAEAIAAHL